MKMLLSVLFLCVFLGSCTKKKPSCDLTEKYAATAGQGIATLFACKNPDAITKDIQDTIEDLKMCENTTPTGPIAAIVCKPVASYVTKVIVNKVLPKKWECTGGVPGTALETFIYSSCATLPF